MRKYIAVILITVCIVFGGIKAFGQKTDVKFNRDSSKSITKADFDSRVDRSIHLLQTKELSAISDTDHINIMMCLNTIFMIHPYMSIEQTYKGGRYAQLETIMRAKKYEAGLTKIYPDFIPNRGMGFYFPKLKMELYGTPFRYAIFNVIE